MLFLCLFFASAQAIASDIKSVYLTWEQEDTSSHMVVHVLSLNKLSSLKIKFKEKTIPYSQHRDLKPTPFNVYSFALQKLSPNTLYHFEVLESKTLKQKYKFKTLPTDNSAIEIVSGGDLSVHPDIAIVAKKTITKNTKVLLIGGDIAYADGDTSRHQLWSQIWDHLNQAMITPDGRLLPLVVAIGNHETNKKKEVDAPTKAPFYFLFFRQNSLSTYFKRNLANHTSIFTLDSGHVADHGGPQKDWLKKELKTELKKENKLALYHVPLYPSFRDFKDKKSKKGRKAWQPLFDEFGLDVALENHDHALKRTKMLKNEKTVDKNGTVYVGDGCWAVAPRPASTSRWYLQTTLVEKHLWRILLTPQKINFEAIGKSGKTLDSFTLKNGKVTNYEK
jgi:hypothetical protein